MINVVNNQGANWMASGQALAVSVPTTPKAGSMVVAFVVGTKPVREITSGSIERWVRVFSLASDANHDYTEIWVGVAGDNPAFVGVNPTIYFSGDVTWGAAVVVEAQGAYEGFDVLVPFTNDASASGVTKSITPLHDNALILYGLATTFGSALASEAEPTGYSLLTVVRNTANLKELRAGWKQLGVAAASSVNPTWSPAGFPALAAIALLPIAASAGPSFPTVGQDTLSDGLQPWTNPGNVTANDGSSATATVTSSAFQTNHLVAKTFGFAVPSIATVLGIEITILASSIPDGGLATGPSKDAVSSLAPTTVFNPGLSTFGGPTDLWGTTWTPAEINAALFSVLTQGFTDISGGGCVVDYITVSIYYSKSGKVAKQTNALFPKPILVGA